MKPRSVSLEDSLRRSLLEGLEERVRELDDRQRYLLNPQDFAYEVVGREVLAKAAGRDMELTDKQVDFLRAFVDRDISDIIIKSGRGNSKTLMFAIGLALLAYTDGGFTATVLAGSLEQAQYLYHYFSIFAESKRFARCIDGHVWRTRTYLKGGGWIYVLTASEKQVKGPHPAMLVFDEMCAADDKIIDLAEGQLLGSRVDKPLYRVASTPDKLFHTFRDYWNNADDYGFVRFEWSAFDCPWISADVIERNKRRKSKNWVRIHIYGEFGSATGTVYDFEDVDASSIKSLDKDEFYSEGLITGTCIGIDWGFKHPTVFVVASCVQFGQEDMSMRVYYVRHVEGYSMKPEEYLYERARRIIKEYAGDFYMDSSHIFQNEVVSRIAQDHGKRATPIAFSKDKMTMIGWTNNLLEKRAPDEKPLVRIPSGTAEEKKLLEQLSNYTWEENQEKPRKIDDDYVDAFNLALHGFNQPRYGAVEIDEEFFG